MISNREYSFNLSLYNDKFFNTDIVNDIMPLNRVSILVYGYADVNVVNDIQYTFPMVKILKSVDLFPGSEFYMYERNGVFILWGNWGCYC